MVKVIVKRDYYTKIELKFPNCEYAGKVMDVLLAAAIDNISFEVEVLPEPTEEPKEEPVEVPAEEPQVEPVAVAAEPQEESVDTF